MRALELRSSINVIGILICCYLSMIAPSLLAKTKPLADSLETQSSSNIGSIKLLSNRVMPIEVFPGTDNNVCLECHGADGFARPEGEFGESEKRHLNIGPELFAKSVHAQQSCVGCHVDIKQMPHVENIKRTVECLECHKSQHFSQWKSLEGEIASSQIMAGLPVDTLEGASQLTINSVQYLTSIHGRAKENGNLGELNANCWDCHGKHNVFPASNIQSPTHRLSTPQTCGQCHQEQLADYKQSIHGAAITRNTNIDAAVCSDCHSAHEIESPSENPVKIAITNNCGNCHDDQLMSYQTTYHGQINKLGYAYTAKCFDCHAHHTTQAIDSPSSKIHLDNRLETCQQCHENATQGFVSFKPHGHPGDFEKYPLIWLVQKFMLGLLFAVFTFFWGHSILWAYREYKESKEAAVHAHISVSESGQTILANPEGEFTAQVTQTDIEVNEDAVPEKQITRFSKAWRWAHLILAIAVMTLVITGTPVLFAESFWAPILMTLLGGPEIAAFVHRVAACTFAVIFFGHIAYLIYVIFIRDKGKFEWFGPDSLIPNWKDLSDVIAMFKWFFGKGPKPLMDRWAYWEKFDYWAPFWGMFIIGLSGLVMWFPEFFASFLPGIIFNLAIIVHAEEAFLATVFLFSVHYFNCHFRPLKFPVDVVMFSGSMPISEFKEEHTLEYQRMVENGTLEKYLVDAPSAEKERKFKRLGITLIVVGLVLLVLVLQGFIAHYLF